MEDTQQAEPKIRPFSVGKLFLCVVTAFLIDSALAFTLPFILFAIGGFNIHASSSPSGLPAYFLINFALLCYMVSKGRDAASGFLIGALLSTLLVWEFIN
ncbi:MAG TPA: hypothetical protein VFO93_19750 [Hymenobacter sp.]|uniref:hypothetical protein n=1 Tax=Hymenobacter sp. TaxID=1898978 RepID=UPI002D7FF76D|nr:hypothetical protein [Hymenobacter sp.]HET9505790.1 hypothetical protein [Hymenobacter sp.]